MATLFRQALSDGSVTVSPNSPRISEALNRTNVGILPRGVSRGFVPRIVEPYGVALDVDPVSGDSAAIVQTQYGYHLNVRVPSVVAFDFTGLLTGRKVSVVLRGTYVVDSSASAEVMVVDDADVDAYDIVLASLYLTTSVVNPSNGEVTIFSALNPFFLSTAKMVAAGIEANETGMPSTWRNGVNSTMNPLSGGVPARFISGFWREEGFTATILDDRPSASLAPRVPPSAKTLRVAKTDGVEGHGSFLSVPVSKGRRVVGRGWFRPALVQGSVFVFGGVDDGVGGAVFDFVHYQKFDAGSPNEWGFVEVGPSTQLDGAVRALMIVQFSDDAVGTMDVCYPELWAESDGVGVLEFSARQCVAQTGDTGEDGFLITDAAKDSSAVKNSLKLYGNRVGDTMIGGFLAETTGNDVSFEFHALRPDGSEIPSVINLGLTDGAADVRIGGRGVVLQKTPRKTFVLTPSNGVVATLNLESEDEGYKDRARFAVIVPRVEATFGGGGVRQFVFLADEDQGEISDDSAQGFATITVESGRRGGAQLIVPLSTQGEFWYSLSWNSSGVTAVDFSIDVIGYI